MIGISFDLPCYFLMKTGSQCNVVLTYLISNFIETIDVNPIHMIYS